MPGSVAVEVMNSPATNAGATAAVKPTSPLVSVVTSAEPSKVAPSPKPLRSQALLAKSSTRKVVLAVLLSVPETVKLPSRLREDGKVLQIVVSGVGIAGVVAAHANRK